MYQKPSLNQQKCRVHLEPFAIAYKKAMPQDPIEAAIDVIDVVEVLRPVFEITSADLRLGCSKKEDRKKDTNVEPRETGWHIRCSNVPKETQPDREFASSGFAPNFEVATLSKPTDLIDAIKHAIEKVDAAEGGTIESTVRVDLPPEGYIAVSSNNLERHFGRGYRYTEIQTSLRTRTTTYRGEGDLLEDIREYLEYGQIPNSSLLNRLNLVDKNGNSIAIFEKVNGSWQVSQ